MNVPTVDGDVELAIPSGTQPGKVIRMKGKGVPRLRRNGRGDQLVVVSVDIPRTLDSGQRELFEKLAGTLGSEEVLKERGFMDSLRDLFGGFVD